MNKLIALTIIGLISLFVIGSSKAQTIECLEVEGDGDKAHYLEGLHQIFNGGLLFGSDDVYTKEYGYLQCFCSPEGEGIQTVWTRDEEGISGEQWDLGKENFNPVNTEYSCSVPTPTPVVTPTPNPVRTPAPAAPPEWSDPCFYLQGHDECKPKSEVFPNEQENFGPNK